jgi:hypothetical protein
MAKANIKSIIVFDNGGKTFDRYTILNKKTGDINGSSNSPFHPQGFGQHCGNASDRLNITFGYNWRRGHTEKGIQKLIKSEVDNFINEAKGNSEWLGKEVKVADLPEDVQKYCRQILN